MSKIIIRFFSVGSLLMFSACTTVQDANYNLYKTRLQAQSYVLGKRLKPLPHPRAKIRRISNRNQQYCPPSNNRAKRKVLKGSVYKVKRVPIQRAKTVYRAKPVAQRYVAPHRVKPAYKPRPVVRKAVVQPRQPALQAVAPRVPLNQLNDGLFAAAKGGNVAQITNFLSQGAQVNAKNGSGETALHAAAALGRAGAVSLLLQKGANPNARTTGGWTPLHSAARFRHASVARLLVSRGASVNVRNNQGKTAMALAEQVGARATVITLKGLGGH